MEESSAIASSRVPLAPGPAHPAGKHFPAKPVSMGGWECLSRVGWWSRVCFPCWAPHGWAGRSARATQKPNRGYETFAAWDVGEETWVTEESWRVVFPYYLSIPFKKSNWACCAFFSIIWAHKTVLQTELNQRHCPSPAQKGQWVFSTPRWAPPPHMGDAMSTDPFIEGSWEKAVGRQQKKSRRKLFWRYVRDECCQNVGSTPASSFVKPSFYPLR